MILNQLDTALYLKLSADATLVALLAAGVDSVFVWRAPQDSVPPYVISPRGMDNTGMMARITQEDAAFVKSQAMDMEPGTVRLLVRVRVRLSGVRYTVVQRRRSGSRRCRSHTPPVPLTPVCHTQDRVNSCP